MTKRITQRAARTTAKRQSKRRPKTSGEPRLVTRRFPLDVYNRRVTFFYGTVEQINSALRSHTPRELLGDHCDMPVNCRGRYRMIEWEGYESDYLCLVRSSLATELASLAHECIHLAVHALDTAGVQPATSGNDEPLTYYAQYLMRQCLSVFMPDKP